MRQGSLRAEESLFLLAFEPREIPHFVRNDKRRILFANWNTTAQRPYNFFGRLLRRPILRDAHRSQSSFALALHPPAAQQGDRPDGPPSPEDCAFPRQAEIFTAAVQEHVAAFLLPWAE